MRITAETAPIGPDRFGWRRGLREGRATIGLAGVADLRLAATLAVFVGGWRLLILGLSWLWGQLPIAVAWPPGVGTMWLWRYSIRWDAGFYLDIALHGYHYQPGYSSSIAFFPLYPLLIRVAHLLLPHSDAFAALVVSQLAVTGALIYVFRIARLDFDSQVAWRSVFLLLIFPGAFFFSAVYPEGLLLLGIAGSLYHARRGQWLRAGLFGMAAGATKLVGGVMIVPLLVELWSQRAVSPRRPWPLLCAALAPLGTLAYLAYLQFRYGDFRVLFETESHWFRHSFQPAFLNGIDVLRGDTTPLNVYPFKALPSREFFLALDTTVLLLFLAAGVVLWLRVRPSYGALVLAYLMVPAFSGSTQSMNRFVAVLFPAFILLARIRSEPLRAAITGIFCCGLAATIYLFVNGLWAG